LTGRAGANRTRPFCCFACLHDAIALVEAEAVRTAYAPNQNVTSGSRVNSKVISNMQHPMDVNVQAQQGSGTVAK
jgi:hypothetical protein